MQHLSPLLRLIRSRANASTSSTPFSTALIDTLGPLQSEISPVLVSEMITLLTATASSARILRRELMTQA